MPPKMRMTRERTNTKGGGSTKALRYLLLGAQGRKNSVIGDDIGNIGTALNPKP